MFGVKLADYSKAFYLSERRVHWSSALFLFSGFRKIKGWKRLSGFRRSSENFYQRLSMDKLHFVKLAAILGQKKVCLKSDCDLSWTQKLSVDRSENGLSALRGKFLTFDEYLDRGVITPFSFQIFEAAREVQLIAKKEGIDTNIFLAGILQNIEQLILKSFVLTLNINRIKGLLCGENESDQYQAFISCFNSPEFRQRFFQDYPVLSRMVISRLELWVKATEELILRLSIDREILESELDIVITDPLVSIKAAGDTHNGGRAVTILFFRSGLAAVYKPRSASLEKGFQEYLNYFNSVVPELNLRQIRVVNRITYGWVEFIHYLKPQPGLESNRYHYKLGFLTAIVYSLNGVDIFFENLIASGTDPVIIDLESMFHTPIDTGVGAGPALYTQLRLHKSVTGIGVLPHPGRGASETEAFDVTVLGAAVNARAPYNVTSIENFGRGDMKITETPGWINETTSSSVEGSLDYLNAQCVYEGIKKGFKCLRSQHIALSEPNGVVDRCFPAAERRLIVRDTKVYGSLQTDETHPDLLRDQSDREWHLDNLWSETIERPHLLRFIESEIIQVRQGDIPYFFGPLNTFFVSGADGTSVDLRGILADTPIAQVKAKLARFSHSEEREELRLAATALGLANINGVTQPAFSLDGTPLSNVLEVVSFISRRAEILGGAAWFDTTLNPVPAAKNIDPVNILPSDPFLYEGVLGIAMFFYDVWRVNGDQETLQSSLRFTDSVLREVKVNQGFSSSGFVGISSIVYVINRAIESQIDSYDRYESFLPEILVQVEEKIALEGRLDFLLGISGVGCAILPYVRRTGDKVGIRILLATYSRLQSSAYKILKERDKIEGLDYLKGFSHGLSGIALAIYRIGCFLDKSCSEDLAAKLLLLEHESVLADGWTDSHSHEGQPLVGWCHGSAGIVLALSQMTSITGLVSEVETYYDSAFKNTFKKYDFQSKCLCHGTLGNLLCLQATNRNEDQVKKNMLSGEISLIGAGFKSLGAAQTMSVGLMTGMAGAGYFLLGQDRADTNFDFLTLA